MARYIDAEALRKRMFSYYGCINENTAKENYRGVTLMDYEVADLIEDCIDNAPTADVVPKSEVEELSGKYEDLKLKYAELQKDKDELIAWSNDKKTEVKLDFTEEEIMRSLREAGIEVSDKSIPEIKAEVAREIFEELARKSTYVFPTMLYTIAKRDVDELKNKYTEEQE